MVCYAGEKRGQVDILIQPDPLFYYQNRKDKALAMHALKLKTVGNSVGQSH